MQDFSFEVEWSKHSIMASSGATARRVRAPRRGESGAANPTRRRILAAALTLFNAQGTARVTTNHVAAAAGLSPGNLYYWFRNKQELVRALVGQWLVEFEQHWDEVHDLPANVHALWDDLGRTAELNRRYRFVSRELLALIHDDPELARTVRETYRRRIAAQVAYARRLVRAGVLQAPAPPRTLDDLVTALWLVAENWPAHLALTRDEKDPGRAPSGVRPMLAVLAPYLTEQGLRAFEAL
jgi:AcrR family transcriptional regulator